MTKPSTVRTADDRRKADRLRAIRERLRSIGKKGLADLFAAGEMLEEAASLHDGTFSAWVKAECGIEPRTALGYRKTFLILGDRKDWLAKRNVGPSVALTIACAAPDGRERALAAIASGRALSVAEAKAIVRDHVPPTPPSEEREVMRRTAREFSKRFAREAELLLMGPTEREAAADAKHVDLATRARSLLSIATALAALPTTSTGDEADTFLKAIADLADPDGASAEAAFRPPVTQAAGVSAATGTTRLHRRRVDPRCDPCRRRSKMG